MNERVLRPNNAKRLYTDVKSIELEEIIETNRKVKMKSKGTVLLLCLISTLQPVRLGWTYQGFKLQPA